MRPAVIQAAGQRPSRARSPWPRGLSDRGSEVRLAAGGLSNRQIADALVISPRTAEHHIQHVYAKIGVSTRAAAAMFAMEHGLLAERRAVSVTISGTAAGHACPNPETGEVAMARTRSRSSWLGALWG